MRELLETLTTTERWKVELRETPFTAVLLHALGITVLVLTVAGGLLALWRRASLGQVIDGSFVVLLVSGFILGLTMGGLLWGMARLLRTVSSGRLIPAGSSGLRLGLLDSDDMAPASTADADAIPGTNRHDYAQRLVSESFQAATRIDLSLFDPTQREEVRERVMALVQRRAAESVVDAVNRRQLSEARQWLQEAEAFFGTTPTTERLDAKIVEASRRNEPLDFARAKHAAETTRMTGRWTSAEDAARLLCLNHPESSRCRQLWDETRRARLHAIIETRAREHRWPEACAAAREFIERFSDSREAEALRAQLPTLQANAEIMQRKQYESRIKELVGNHEYEDAVRLARLVIEKYPDSPQATALRIQLPLLEKRAAV